MGEQLSVSEMSTLNKDSTFFCSAICKDDFSSIFFNICVVIGLRYFVIQHKRALNTYKLSKISNFRSDYEYENEYEYEFRISKQICSQSSLSFMLLFCGE